MRAVLATIAVEKYLGSGLIKGIGPVMASVSPAPLALNARHHRTSPATAARNPRHRAQASADDHLPGQNNAIKVIFLQSNGVSTSLATKIYKHYGDSQSPSSKTTYRLARHLGHRLSHCRQDCPGIGLALDDPRRIAAGVPTPSTRPATTVMSICPELIRQTGELIAVPPNQIGGDPQFAGDGSGEDRQRNRRRWEMGGRRWGQEGSTLRTPHSTSAFRNQHSDIRN